MILTPVANEHLAAVLNRFEDGLSGQYPRLQFRQIRTTSAARANGVSARRHRRMALTLARALGMPIHPPDRGRLFNWDGKALNGATEAYVILHEMAHFVLAPPARRGLADFGLGPGPDTLARAAAARVARLPAAALDADEAAASLLGILWEARLGQPALASFLDQNWLEGLERSAAAHFTAVLERLRRRGLLAPGVPAPCRPL